jgi:hypothetical protein
MRSWKLLLPLLASTLCFAQQPDRITAPINSSQMVALTGNVHGFAQPRFDLGRTDSGRVLYGVTLAFRPSAAQKTDLNNLLAQQQDRLSPNYHKWLTPAEFADRFGMTRNDVNRVVAWLEAQGFTVTSIANSRNQISFEGTVAQVETVFRTEIHNYLVDGEIHFANATNPSVPAALAGLVPAVGHLHNFSPKPRAQFRTRSLTGAQPHFTTPFASSSGEDHFLAPGDFATIYNLPGLDGTNQTIAVVGQSTVSANDLANFRVAAGLAAKAPQYILYPSTSTGTRCPGDEGESDLDLEWSGGVAANANIIFVYAGLLPGESCGENRTYSVWDALQQTVDNNYAPIISTSYGACEAINGEAFAVDLVQAWAQQANAQGQTIMAASGDAGAADCDATNSPSATRGLAVDVPASIPEVTGMGGTEFTGDAEAVPSGGNTPATTYWKGTTGGISTLSSALSYIPEMGWNDTVQNDGLLASGGGASIYFPKTEAPWQTGTGVPNDGARDVPDLALNASPYHDPYLICSEDGQASPCTNGFVSESGEILLAGGTSCAAPTFSAIVALLNQSLGSSGLGNINPTLYSLAASNPAAFHDVTSGTNDVPCTSGTTDCPSGTTEIGFSAHAGYDQVTGLGSVNASTLFTAWAGSRTASSITITSPPTGTNVTVGTSVSFKVAVTPASGVGTVSFSTLNNGTATPLGTVTLNVPYPSTTTGTATFATSALPGGTNSVTATYEGDTAHKAATSAPTTVTVTVPFTVSSAPSSRSVSAGQTATYAININPTSGFTGTVSFTNSTTSSPGSCNVGLPAGTFCSFSPGSVALDGVPADTKTVTLTITTAANMALPSGAQAITVTGTSGSTAIPTTVDLTVTATTESFTLTTTSGASTFPVTVGGPATIPITVNSTTGFINSGNNTTVLPLTYTATGCPSEANCSFSPSQGEAVTATAVTLNIQTEAPTSQLSPPLGRGSRIFYALLLPGLFGIVFAAGSRTHGLRLLGMIVVLGFSTLWLGACGGSGGGGTTTPPNPGTPPGSYPLTITATTKGANPVTFTLTGITLNVTP